MLKIWNDISKRWLYLAGASTVAGLFCSALYLQYVLRQEPCPLCMIQRVIFITIGVLFLIAALHDAKRMGAKVYSVLIALTALGWSWGRLTSYLDTTPAQRPSSCLRPGSRFHAEALSDG